jgi:hypothetical protein
MSQASSILRSAEKPPSLDPQPLHPLAEALVPKQSAGGQAGIPRECLYNQTSPSK